MVLAQGLCVKQFARFSRRFLLALAETCTHKAYRLFLLSLLLRSLNPIYRHKHRAAIDIDAIALPLAPLLALAGRQLMQQHINDFVAVLLVERGEGSEMAAQFLPVAGIEVVRLLLNRGDGFRQAQRLRGNNRLRPYVSVLQRLHRFLRGTPEEGISASLTLEAVDAAIGILARTTLVGF